MKLVPADYDVMLIADNGIVIRVKAKDISVIGRDTLGVKIMKVDNGKVAVVAITPASEDEEVDSEVTAENTATETTTATDETKE